MIEIDGIGHWSMKRESTELHHKPRLQQVVSECEPESAFESFNFSHRFFDFRDMRYFKAIHTNHEFHVFQLLPKRGEAAP